MTRNEFLEQLRSALSSSLSAAAVQENVNYYNMYIEEEVKNGKDEAKVLDMLGDPWILARTIIDAQDGTDRTTVYESQRNDYYGYEEGERETQGSSQMHVFQFTWWKTLLVILGIIGVMVLVVSAITGLVTLLMPIIVPIVIIMLVIRLINGRK